MIGVTRLSVSLPDRTYDQLEEIIIKGKWKSRSQVIAQLVRAEYIELSSKQTNSIMAGSITLFYSEDHREILTHVSRIQRDNINEVISSNRILLEHNHVMEVLVVQGHISKLEQIQQQFLNIKGVETGKLTLTNTILPPIHTK